MFWYMGLYFSQLKTVVADKLEIFTKNSCIQFFLIFLFYFFLSYSTLYHSIVAETWPETHELRTFFLRTYIYTRHFSQWDFFPVWSVLDNHELGSPQPILYHKIFYLFAAFFYLLTASLKVSIVLTLLLFMVVGAFGVFKLCKFVGCSSFIAFCGGAMLIVANYTVTNWLIRGAVAESVGAMIVPWFLLECLRSLTYSRITKRCVFYFCLIFLSHSVLAYYCLLIVGTLGILYTLFSKTFLHFFSWKNLIGPFLVGAVTTGPYLYAMMVIGKDYDLERLGSQYVPKDEFKPLLSYLWDTEWVWGRAFVPYTIQIDVPLLVLFVIGIVILVVGVNLRAIYRNSLFFRSFQARDYLITYLFGGILIICVVLQLSMTLPFYDYFPGAAYIQFPWRLLSLVTPVLIVLCLFLISFPSFKPVPMASNSLSVIALGFMIFFCGAYPKIQYGMLSTLEPKLKVHFSYTGEFKPVSDTREGIRDLVNPKCTVTRHPSPPEWLDVVISVDCSEDTEVILPIYQSPAHILEVGEKYELCQTNAEFPALCAVSVRAGKPDILVRMPTMGRVFLARFLKMVEL